MMMHNMTTMTIFITHYPSTDLTPCYCLLIIDRFGFFPFLVEMNLRNFCYFCICDYITRKSNVSHLNKLGPVLQHSCVTSTMVTKVANKFCRRFLGQLV